MKSSIICGYYGADNWGDELMLRGMTSLLKSLHPKWKFTIFSNNPKLTEIQHGFCAKPLQISPRRWIGKFEFIRDRLPSLLSHEFFILGGGDLLRDSLEYDVAKDWLDRLEQAIFWRRKPLILGISVGEIWKSTTIHRIPVVLNKVPFIGVRDQQSIDRLQSLGVRSEHLFLLPDLALQLSKGSNPRQTGDDQTLKIGLSLRDLEERGQVVQAIDRNAFVSCMAESLDRIISKTNIDLEIHAIPFQGKRDLAIIKKILNKCEYKSKVCIREDLLTVEQLSELVSSLDIMIGMRLHSLILAANFGVPVLALSYDVKVSGFMTEIQCSQDLLSISEVIAGQLPDRFDHIISNLDATQERVVSGVVEYLKKTDIVLPGLARVLKAY